MNKRKLNTATDVRRAFQEIYNAARAGLIEPKLLNGLVVCLNSTLGAIEREQLAERVARLEALAEEQDE